MVQAEIRRRRKLNVCVKEKVSDAMEVTIEITDENVFSRCPVCGEEVQVDIAELLSDGESDLFGTSVLCSDCTRKMMGGRKHVSEQV